MSIVNKPISKLQWNQLLQLNFVVKLCLERCIYQSQLPLLWLRLSNMNFLQSLCCTAHIILDKEPNCHTTWKQQACTFLLLHSNATPLFSDAFKTLSFSLSSVCHASHDKHAKILEFETYFISKINAMDVWSTAGLHLRYS